MFLIITVNYNNAELTNKMLNSISACSKCDNISVVVVDNNSTDVNQIQNFSFCQIIKLKENIGYFPALNVGIKSIDVINYEKIIICNNDLIFAPDFFINLKKNKYASNVYAISPRILDLDGNEQNPMLSKGISYLKVHFYDLYYKNYFFGIFIYKIWQIIKLKKNLKYDGVARQIFMGYGAIYVLTKSFFIHNKLLDTPPFLMGEEAFLAEQIFITNGIEYYDPSLLVYHQDHSSCSKIPKRTMYNISKESYKIYRKKFYNIPRLK